MFGFSRGTELPEAWTERPPASPGQGVGWLMLVSQLVNIEKNYGKIHHF